MGLASLRDTVPLAARRHGVAMGALAVLVTGVLAAAGGDGFAWGRWHLDGADPWRWATAHLVHATTWHAIVNLLGALLLWASFARVLSPRVGLLLFIAGGVGVDLGLALTPTPPTWYAGASGALHGVWAGGALLATRAGERWLAAVAGGLLLAKLGYEAMGPTLAPSGLAGLMAYTPAHLAGALGGALVALPAAVSRRARYNPRPARRG